MLRNALLACAATMMVAACADQRAVGPIVGPRVAQDDAVQFWESNASVYWNAVARQLVAANRSSALQAIRGYAIVSVAQYNAAIAAEKGTGPGNGPQKADNDPQTNQVRGGEDANQAAPAH